MLVPLAVLTVAAVAWLHPWSGDAAVPALPAGTPVDGTVTAVAIGPCGSPGAVRVGEPDPDAPRCLDVEVRITEVPGGAAGSATIAKMQPLEPGSPRFAAGDEVVLSYGGGDPLDGGSYQIKDFQRGVPLLALGALFVLAVLLLGRKRGLAALGSLGLSVAVLVLFVLPAILAGRDPLLVAIAAAGLIMFGTLYLTHGFTARTSVAVLGTLSSLTLIGVLATLFASAAALTGLDSDTTSLIASLGHGVDARGLLLAGVVIGALGVLDDVTVTQASAVWELRRANPALGRRELYTAALRIGRDHVGSAVNTLVLAYAGAALPLLLLSALSDVGPATVLQSQDVAQEVVRTLAGSIGIVAAVPVTTLLAALIAVHDDVPGNHVPGNDVPGNDVPGNAAPGAVGDEGADRAAERVSAPGPPRTG
ncbi:YibE/F family protein [Saccharomonospora iraqiensis]|uniref:YibE/F family protein n=1 Tax=Saccharomonospora iraqiensis TaxID=52698 RepID=UPI00022DF8EF|nr:YibE/F family protein [Saccharomonospora iraqiensis]